MDKKIRDALINMGIYPNLIGFDYICKAVAYIDENKNIGLGEIYQRISEEKNSTPSSVGRAIKHAFSTADTDSEEFKKYLSVNRATNSVMLFTLATRLKDD